MKDIDVFDESYNRLPQYTASIDEVHTKGLWHQTFACWLVNKDRQDIYLQHRGPKNRIDPGSFDASASGHLYTGEKPDDGFREMREELGIKVGEDTVYKLGVFRNIAYRKNNSYINHEFCHIYMLDTTKTLDDLTPEEGEVNNVYALSVDEGLQLFKGEVSTVKIRDKDNNLKTISIEDMCNHTMRSGDISNYYLKILLCAQDLIFGKTDIYI